MAVKRRSPAALGSAGRRVWRRFAADVESSRVDLELLGVAFTLADQLSRIDASSPPGT